VSLTAVEALEELHQEFLEHGRSYIFPVYWALVDALPDAEERALFDILITEDTDRVDDTHVEEG